MRICPKCRASYPLRGRSTCAADGTRLIDAEEYARSQNDPLIGRELAGRFRISERIGTGGMGTVYRAQQAGLGRPVALKVLKKELVSDRDTVARFHREAKAMSMLMHPNTVRVFDFGEDEEGHLFLAMELLEGELLTAWMERDDAPPVDEAVEIVIEILHSLAEAHQKGLIHRDLKPDNIFLARVEGHSRPVVKVLDFGIAKVFRSELKIDELETQAGTVFGTPRYMSPEQAQGKTLDHRSDLYAVGVLLYQLLVGRPPFVDDDAVVVMAKHIRETPDPPHVAAPDRPIPRSLQKLVQRALAKDPEHRYGNADQLAGKLHGCLPDIRREQRRRASGRASVGGLPRTPLMVGGAIVGCALITAVAMVAQSWLPEDASVASHIARLPAEPPPIAEPPHVQAAPASVTLVSDPEGAEIFAGDERVGTTPHTFEISGSETRPLTLRARGFEPLALELRGSAGPIHEVTLQREEEERPRPRAHRAAARARASAPTASPSTAQRRDPYERFD